MTRFAVESAGAATMRVAGRDAVVFAGCDYLGLAHDPEVVEALRRGIERYGVSASASRATTGNAEVHDDLERDLARFLGLEAALLVPDGYLSNLVVAQGLAHDVTTAIVDREAHVSVHDALAAAGIGATGYDACDVRAAASAIEATRRAASAANSGASSSQVVGASSAGACAIWTDGAYPVLRKIAPLRELLALLPRDGLLVVDDCHATGVLGARGRGSHEHAGVTDARLVITGTLSKALGCFGGFVAGTRDLVERVRARSRAFAASTPIPPALALAGSAAVRVLERDTSRVVALCANVERVRSVLRARGIDAHDLPLPVFAWKAASPEAGARVHEGLLERGVLVPHVTYPDGLGSYFRLAVSAAHDETAIGRLDAALQEALRTR